MEEMEGEQVSGGVLNKICIGAITGCGLRAVEVHLVVGLWSL